MLSLVGQGLPLIVGVVSIPFLLSGLGTARFGILTLVWVIIGYASVVDMGLGRALTQAISVRLGTEESSEIPLLIWTALVAIIALGLSGALLIVSGAPWIAADVLSVPDRLVGETLWTLYLLALSLPAVIATTGLRGVLEAYQRFDLTTVLRVPMGIYSFLAPLVVLPFSVNLAHVVAVLVAGRIVATAAHAAACFHVVPGLGISIRFSRRHLSSLLSFGGWLTVSNIVAPLMLYIDRFIVAGVLSIASVAYYATPYEMITKLWLVPTSVLAVMFPAFSASFTNDRERTATLYKRTLLVVLLLLAPFVVVGALFARPGLDLWLNAEFAANGSLVAQILFVGVLLHSLAMSSGTLIQAAGRPALAAVLHLIQLPVYAGILLWMTVTFGVVGAALAWTTRAGVTLLVMHIIANRLLSGKQGMRRAT